MFCSGVIYGIGNVLMKLVLSDKELKIGRYGVYIDLVSVVCNFVFFVV